MKLVSISDPHWHNYKAHSTLIDGANSRLLDVSRAVHKATTDGFNERECKLMTISGDLFHVRGKIRPSIMNAVMDEIRFAAEHFSVVILPGNHDMEDYKGGATAVDFLSEMDGVYVIDRPQIIEVDGLRILGIPYIHDIGDFKLTASALAEDASFDIAMIHQGLDDMTVADFPDFGLTSHWVVETFGAKTPILCGHYHSARRKQNVIQVGSPLQHNFGDEGDQRGYWVVDTKTNRHKFYKIDSPEFVTVVDDKAEVRTGDFIRIKAATVKAAAKLAELYSMAAGVTVQIDKKFVAVHERTIKISNTETMISEYIDLFPDYLEDKAEIMKLYDEVCR